MSRVETGVEGGVQSERRGVESGLRADVHRLLPALHPHIPCKREQHDLFSPTALLACVAVQEPGVVTYRSKEATLCSTFPWGTLRT